MKAPVAVATSGTTLRLFLADGNGTVRTCTLADGGPAADRGWDLLEPGVPGGLPADAPLAVDVSGRGMAVDDRGRWLAVVGNDGRVHRTTTDRSGNPGWQAHGGGFAPGAAVALAVRSAAEPLLDLVVTDGDGTVHQQTTAPDRRLASPWLAVNPPTARVATGRPVAVVRPGDLECYAVDASGTLHRWVITGSPRIPPEAYPSPAINQLANHLPEQAPVVAVVIGTHVHLFHVGGDGSVQVRTDPSSSGTATSLGGDVPVGAPLAACEAAGLVEVFVVGHRGEVVTGTWSPPGSAVSWRGIGGAFPVGSPLTAATDGAGQLHLFGRDAAGNVHRTSRTGTGWAAWRAVGKVAEPVAAAVAIFEGPVQLRSVLDEARFVVLDPAHTAVLDDVRSVALGVDGVPGAPWGDAGFLLDRRPGGAVVLRPQAHPALVVRWDASDGRVRLSQAAGPWPSELAAQATFVLEPAAPGASWGDVGVRVRSATEPNRYLATTPAGGLRCAPWTTDRAEAERTFLPFASPTAPLVVSTPKPTGAG